VNRSAPQRLAVYTVVSVSMQAWTHSPAEPTHSAQLPPDSGRQQPRTMSSDGGVLQVQGAVDAALGCGDAAQVAAALALAEAAGAAAAPAAAAVLSLRQYARTLQQECVAGAASSVGSNPAEVVGRMLAADEHRRRSISIAQQRLDVRASYPLCRHVVYNRAGWLTRHCRHCRRPLSRRTRHRYRRHRVRWLRRWIGAALLWTDCMRLMRSDPFASSAGVLTMKNK
jgi:hypothetical protein